MNAYQLISVIFFYLLFDNKLTHILCMNYSYIDLPATHLPFYFNNFPNVANACKTDPNCLHQNWLNANDFDSNLCWGYEDNCRKEYSFLQSKCTDTDTHAGTNKQHQIDTFYSQADFGYIRQQLREMKVMCEPLFPHDSVLECSSYLRFCRGRNIFVNFTDVSLRKEPVRYKTDILKEGDIGGYCKLNKQRLEAELDHLSALQSWAPELRYFKELNERPVEAKKCDRIINKPTYFMKIDATINMYHHFCDFFNLYASLHVNMTHPTTFSTDNNILIWETFDYESPFSIVFKAFTKNPILDLKAFRGETVCFRNLVLPLLPRMIFGLYYNTPIINGCEQSGLFEAFSQHILHRLNIPLHAKSDQKIRIHLLSRHTKFRQILNIDELVSELQKNESYVVQKIHFERDVKFSDQLEITRNTDIFIGMHGAGLTHLLFLPKWATIFELYHCEDPTCYKDLARLRGVNYITWEDSSKLIQQDEGHHPDMGSHAKFTNYSFDKKEFIRLVNKAAEHVWNHSDFKKYTARNYEGKIENHMEL